MEHGTLIVNVRTGGSAYAVQNAAITVFTLQKPDGSPGVEILAAVKSDLGGQSPEIELPAPAREMSLAPGAAGDGLPFANYIIETVKDGYYTVTNTNVAVFSGVTSIQNVELIPRSAGQSPYPPAGITYDESSVYEL